MAMKSAPEKVYRDNSNEPVIYVTRRETVAIVEPSAYGDHSMVEAAFLAAATYLDELASKGLERPVEVEFDYRGVKFTASAFSPKEGEA